MAKLRARRREEVFRVSRSRTSTTAGVAEVQEHRSLMSDGNLLERSVLRYTPEEVERNYGKKSHDYGWKVRGRVKAVGHRVREEPVSARSLAWLSALECAGLLT